MFCPPGGKFNERRLQQIAAAGFKGVRTVEMISVAAPVQQDGLLIMPTSLQAHPHSSTVYIRNILKRYAAALISGSTSPRAAIPIGPASPSASSKPPWSAAASSTSGATPGNWKNGSNGAAWRMC